MRSNGSSLQNVDRRRNMRMGIKIEGEEWNRWTRKIIRLTLLFIINIEYLMIMKSRNRRRKGTRVTTAAR